MSSVSIIYIKFKNNSSSLTHLSIYIYFDKCNSKSNVHDKKVLGLSAVLEALLSYHEHLNRKYCIYVNKIFIKQAFWKYKR